MQLPIRRRAVRKLGRASIVKLVLAACVFVAGLGVFLYPAIAGFVNEQSQTSAITNYEEAVNALTAEDKADSLEAARSYNEALAETQGAIIDPFGSAGDEGESQEVSFLSVGEVMGYIQIPEIGIKAPIYEGTSEDVLQKGIGWLKGTSLPVGGESTNSVLTGHRGLPTAKLFTDLDQLEPGDEFFVKNSSEILAYRVTEKKVIDPSESDALAIIEGKDLMTLLTCHPYMVNSHRLLIIGERVAYTGQLDEIAETSGFIESMTAAEKDLAQASLLVAACLVLVIVLVWRPWSRKRRGEGGRDG